MRPVVRKACHGDEGGVARHRPRVVVTVFDLVEGIPAQRRFGIPVMDRPAEGKPISDHAFGNHRCRRRIGEARHAFRKVADHQRVPACSSFRRRISGSAMRKGADQSPGFVILRVNTGTLDLSRLSIIAYPRIEIVLKDFSKRRAGLGFRENPRQSGLDGPVLAEKLVNMTADI